MNLTLKAILIQFLKDEFDLSLDQKEAFLGTETSDNQIQNMESSF